MIEQETRPIVYNVLGEKNFLKADKFDWVFDKVYLFLLIIVLVIIASVIIYAAFGFYVVEMKADCYDNHNARIVGLTCWKNVTCSSTVPILNELECGTRK